MLLPILCALGLAGIHLAADRLNLRDVVSRSAWLSAASGASVAFVFLLLVPELVARQDALEGLPLVGGLAHVVWLLVLLGLIAFYVAEHWMLTHGEQRKEATHGAFWGHVGIFSLYNVVIGYLLFDPHTEVADNVLLYAAALALHLLVIDDSMRRHHARRYHMFGRWALAAAVLSGGGIGLIFDLHDAVPAVALGLLAGGIFLNALKEELPGEREGRVGPFAAGAAIYAALALLIAHF